MNNDEKKIITLNSFEEEIVDVSKAEYTYAEMCRDLKILNKRFKRYMKLNIIGKSYDDRNIYEVILGNRKSDKHFLIHAGIHGSEYLNCLLVMKILENYLKSYESGEFKSIKYKTLFNKVAFHIIPMANPDGVTISECGIDKIRNCKLKEIICKCYKEDINDKYTNKNFKDYLRRWKANGRGVDLNRNFNAEWESINQTVHPSFENFKGITYESERESRALVKLTNKYNFIGTISYHSSGNLIYWDYNGSKKRKECSDMADIASGITKYEKAMSDDNYSNVVSGGYKDWACSKNGNSIPSITIEVGSGECPLKISEFQTAYEENYDLWAAYAYSLL